MRKEPRQTEWTEYEFASDVTLAEVLKMLEREGRTGSLTINVSQGRVSSLVWKSVKRKNVFIERGI